MSTPTHTAHAPELTAGHVQEGAVDGGHPQVGGACVKQHCEVLGWSPNADHPIILSLETDIKYTMSD